jgi:hypothetical protein
MLTIELGVTPHNSMERRLCMGHVLAPVGYGYALFRFAEAKETLLLASVGWLLVILGL